MSTLRKIALIIIVVISRADANITNTDTDYTDSWPHMGEEFTHIANNEIVEFHYKGRDMRNTAASCGAYVGINPSWVINITTIENFLNECSDVYVKPHTSLPYLVIPEINFLEVTRGTRHFNFIT